MYFNWFKKIFVTSPSGDFIACLGINDRHKSHYTQEVIAKALIKVSFFSVSLLIPPYQATKPEKLINGFVRQGCVP